MNGVEEVYGDLVRRHMYALRDDKELLRLQLWDAIETLRQVYPEDTQRWEDRYTPEK